MQRTVFCRKSLEHGGRVQGWRFEGGSKPSIQAARTRCGTRPNKSDVRLGPKVVLVVTSSSTASSVGHVKAA